MNWLKWQKSKEKADTTGFATWRM